MRTKQTLFAYLDGRGARTDLFVAFEICAKKAGVLLRVKSRAADWQVEANTTTLCAALA